MAINTKLETIKSGVLGVRSAIKAIDSSLANGTVDTLGDDIRTLNNRKYIWKWVNNNGTYELQKEVSNTDILSGTSYRYNTNLIAVVLPENIKTLSAQFLNDSNLQFINLDNITSITVNSCFQGCSSLSSTVELSRLEDKIPTSTFRATGLTSFKCSAPITTINSSAFRECPNLETVELPQTLTSLSDYVFYRCRKLKFISGLENVTSIDTTCFYECGNLSIELNLPNLTTLIGNGQFSGTGITKVLNLGLITSTPDGGMYSGLVAGCKSLTEITFPSTITKIGQYTCYNCSALETVKCLATSIPELGAYTFYGTNSTFKIYVPYGTSTAYKEATNWINYASRIYELDANGNIPS